MRHYTASLLTQVSLQLSAVGNAWGGARPDPPPAERLDESELPRGPDDCLLGEVFVMTGTLPGLTRYAAPVAE